MINLFLILKNFLYDYKIRNRFINHNNIYFNPCKKDKGIILIEFHSFCSGHIGLSYLSNYLSEKYKSKIIAYNGWALLFHSLKQNFISKIKFYVAKSLNLKTFGIYKSFGTKNIFHPKISYIDSLEAKKEFKKFLKNINTLKKLENYKIKNILVGDLLYDTYLKKKYSLIPTINLKNKDFIDFSYDFISLVIFWINYFKNNRVKSVVTSHSIYSLAITSRIALSKSIPAFVCTGEHLTKLNKKNIYQFGEFHNYKRIFNKLNKLKKKEGLKIAKYRIEERLKGKLHSDTSYISNSSFKKIKIKKINKNKKKTKILIATHNFADAPHLYGNNLFTDFYQWILFLGKISKLTDYDWYIKTHTPFPGRWKKYSDHEKLVVNKFLKSHKNINLLSNKITHQEILNMGIDTVLTVYGTIGFEFPALGIPAITSSKNNPQIHYNFNFHPKNINDLKKIIFNLQKYKKKISYSKIQIYEYYFMKYIYFNKNWLFEDYDKLIKNLGYHEQFHNKVYDYWLKNWSNYKHKKVYLRINRFNNSGHFAFNSELE